MRLKLNLGPPIGSGTLLKTAYVKAFYDLVHYVLNLQQEGLSHGSLTHGNISVLCVCHSIVKICTDFCWHLELVVKCQHNVYSVVEYEDGLWILKLTADLVKQAPKAMQDTKTKDDVQERMGSLFGAYNLMNFVFRQSFG